MEPQRNLGVWVVAWAVLAILLIVRHARWGRSTGLLLSYVLSLAALHWFATFLYLLPWSPETSIAATTEGMYQSVVAMAGLLIGAEIFAAIRRRRPPVLEGLEDSDQIVAPRLVNVYLATGIVLYILLFSPLGRIASLRSLVATGSTLLAVGVALKCWNAWKMRRPSTLALWIAATTAFPLLTVVVQGFLGAGFAAMVVVFSFIAAVRRPSWRAVVLALVMAYAGLSIYVTYMRDRGEIRDLVWNGASTNERVSRLQETLVMTEWFNPSDHDHIKRVNQRLNQNVFVGAAVLYMAEGWVPFAGGTTLIDALWALVPRAFWPEKHVFAGSGDMVSTYTGFKFGPDTSVGIGQVMECYVNFGTPGVLFGFIVIGFLIVLADGSGWECLHRGDPSRFLMWYLPGLSLLQVGGALSEVTATALASFIVAVIFSRIAAGLGHTAAEPPTELARVPF